MLHTKYTRLCQIENIVSAFAITMAGMGFMIFMAMYFA